MILVTLGTGDKQFKRLLEIIDKLIEKEIISDEVVVQSGITRYNSNNMKIFDLINKDEFNNLIKDASLIISHGGVGSILEGLKNEKKVIAVARKERFGECANDHQKYIIDEFSQKGYIIGVTDLTYDSLKKAVLKSKSFKTKKYKSHTKKMIRILESIIEEDNNISWFNKYKYFILILLLVTLIVILL